MELLKATEQQFQDLKHIEGVNFLKSYNDEWVLPANTINKHLDLSKLETIEGDIDWQYLSVLTLNPKFKISQISNVGHSFKDVDYKIHANLFPDRTWNIKGYLTDVVYYADSALTDEVLKVHIDYIDDETEPIPSARSVISRTTTREWRCDLEDQEIEGIVIQGGYIDYLGFKKVTLKEYNSKPEIREEGRRRRGNLVTQLEDGLVAMMFQAGIDPTTIEDKLATFLGGHSGAFGVWRESGKGSIYADIQADTSTTWLTQGMKDYCENKLKGLT